MDDKPDEARPYILPGFKPTKWEQENARSSNNRSS